MKELWSLPLIKGWVRLITVLLALALTSNLFAQNFNYTIYTPVKPAKEVAEAVSDMANWLGRSTGQSYNIKEGPASTNQSIQLLSVNESDLPVKIKSQVKRDGQSFYLVIDGTRSAQIIGSGTNSFINGIYTFLQELGFRWYMPGDAWAIVPKLDRTNLQIKRLYQPDFQNRTYFGTGGMNPVAGIDPQNTFAQDFILWNRRNRWSSDFPTRGHMGQAFYAANQKVLNEHPEYSCQNKVNRNGRIDITQPGAVDLFVKWALTQVDPNNPFSVIGVDPADGSGGPDDCLPSNMPEVKTWSDKYFWLANQVAKEVDKRNLNALVQLYAYASHAAPPSFKLNPQVYPVIIPYAFQGVADPQQYIRLWQTKLAGQPMGIYDYWNITQWSADLPQFSIYSIPEKLRLWKKSNITTINLEATNAKGPMGHSFWLAAQLMWNTQLSFDSLYNTFLKQCFGAGAADVKRMYDRWSQNYQGGMDVGFSLKDLDAASSKEKDTAVQRRISELKAYVYYMKLYYDYQQNPTVDNYKKLINYIYSIHHLRLLQTSALVAYYIKAPKDIKAEEKRSIVSDATVIQKVNTSSIEANTKNALAEVSSTYTLSNFHFDIKKADPTGTSPQAKYNPLHINGRNDYMFYLDHPQKLTLKAGATADTRLVIKDENGGIRLQKTIAGTKDGYDSLMIDLPKGQYTLSFGDYGRFSRIIFPGNITFLTSSRNYDNFQYPLLFIYVPKDVTEVIYSDSYGPGTNRRGDWIDPSGKHINPEKVKYTTYRIPVPSEYRGKVWTFNIGHSSFQLLNIPQIFSLNPFVYKE